MRLKIYRGNNVYKLHLREALGINGVRPNGTVEKSLLEKLPGKSPCWKVPPLNVTDCRGRKSEGGPRKTFAPLAKKHTAYYITLACHSDSPGQTCAILAL